MILESLQVPRTEFEHRTGWALKPEGACKGEFCVPLPSAGDALDARVLSERLGMPLVHDERHGIWSLGPETLGGRILTTAEAPELVLPDLEGRPFALSSLRGQKVVLWAWAPY